MHSENTIQKMNNEYLFQQISQTFLLFNSGQDNSQHKSNKLEVKENNVGVCENKTYLSDKKHYNVDIYLDSLLGKDEQYDCCSQGKRGLQWSNSDNSQNISLKKSEECQKHSNKTEMNKIYTKNYRLKKKEEVNFLRQQNNFLKHKVEDLSFRLKQAQIQVNKLKHADSNQTFNFHSIKEECLKEVQNILSKQQTPYQQVVDLSKKLRNIVAFSHKPRIDFLNYHMSEIMQNLISDQGMYFFQSLQAKTGIWRQKNQLPSKQIDLQILEILNIQSESNRNQNNFKHMFSHHIQTQMKRIKVLWKNLYQDYLKMISQGLKVEAMCRPFFENKKSQNQQQIVSSLKLRLHFQKIKYRKDIRQIRQSWFKEIQEESSDEARQEINFRKKCKNQC